jgi:hypothetical protein
MLSGLATGASWCCYFRALHLGDAARVAPLDKLSVVGDAQVLKVRCAHGGGTRPPRVQFPSEALGWRSARPPAPMTRLAALAARLRRELRVL